MLSAGRHFYLGCEDEQIIFGSSQIQKALIESHVCNGLNDLQVRNFHRVTDLVREREHLHKDW